MRLTVLMTVYNGEEYLRETVDSILNQTYADFKYLILDNASTDKSRDIIRSYDDSRIELVELPENIGQVAALNRGLERVETEFVARIDADDISLPKRFEKQVAFMDTHPGVGVCGTFADAFKGDQIIRWSYPCDPEDIKVKLLFECALVHPSVMIRKNILDKHQLKYDETMKHSYDWELWQRVACHAELANISECLLKYRLHTQSESQRTSELQEEAAQRLDTRELARLGLLEHPLRNIHRDVAFETLNIKNRDPEFLKQTVQWFNALEDANRSLKIYDELALNRFLRQRLFIVLTNNTALGGPAGKLFFKEKLYRSISFLWTLKFITKLILKR
ncbi:MAG: glycosyltransferase [bacterium]|nr:glycosyltransferase [bacterium]